MAASEITRLIAGDSLGMSCSIPMAVGRNRVPPLVDVLNELAVDTPGTWRLVLQNNDSNEEIVLFNGDGPRTLSLSQWPLFLHPSCHLYVVNDGERGNGITISGSNVMHSVETDLSIDTWLRSNDTLHFSIMGAAYNLRNGFVARDTEEYHAFNPPTVS